MSPACLRKRKHKTTTVLVTPFSALLWGTACGKKHISPRVTALPRADQGPAIITLPRSRPLAPAVKVSALSPPSLGKRPPRCCATFPLGSKQSSSWAKPEMETWEGRKPERADRKCVLVCLRQLGSVIYSPSQTATTPRHVLCVHAHRRAQWEHAYTCNIYILTGMHTLSEGCNICTRVTTCGM